MKIIYVILIVIFYQTTSYSQLEELKTELFINQQFITYKVDSTNVSCSLESIDKTLFKESRKPIVDVQTVLKLLKKITFESNEINLDSLKRIYLKFAHEYYQNWGQIYLNGCIRETNSEAENQFKILTGFEQTLKSVSLRNSTPEEIWSTIINEHNFFKELIHNSSEITKTLERIETYSPEYKKLNSKAWYASSCGFTYLEPYINKVQEFYISELNQCKCPFEDGNCDISFIKQNTYYISLIKDERIAKAFIENKNCLSLDQNYFWFPVRYLEKNHNPELLKVTLRALFDSTHAGHIDYKLAHIFRNEENKKIFQDEINRGIELLLITAIENSMLYPNKQTLKSLKRAKKKSSKNSELREIIENQIKRVNYQMKHDS